MGKDAYIIPKGQIITDNSATLIAALAEIERLKEALNKYSEDEVLLRKDAALYYALLALEYHTAQTRPIHVTIEAIKQVREALK